MIANNREEGEAPQTIEEEASATFVQRLHGEWTQSDQAALESRLARDPAYADAYRRVEEAWGSLDVHAEAPEVMAYREEALLYARRANARRWIKGSGSIRNRWRLVAAAAGIALAVAAAWQLSPYGYQPGQYRTGIGEQRLVDLDDRSRIALDAATRVQVRYTDDARTVRLHEGQAQFSVAHDPMRPFKVQVGDRTIVALGTVFTVEYVDQKVHVAMMEGRVAVVPQTASPVSREHSGVSSSTANVSTTSSASSRSISSDSEIAAPRLGVEQEMGHTARTAASTSTIELIAGEELRIARDGRTTVIAEADLEAATAWREGKVIFRTERLGDAVQRLNRYSRLQIEIADDTLAARHISGVFEAGDTQGFVSAVQRYLPVTTEYVGSHTVRLRMN